MKIDDTSTATNEYDFNKEEIQPESWDKYPGLEFSDEYKDRRVDMIFEKMASMDTQHDSVEKESEQDSSVMEFADEMNKVSESVEQLTETVSDLGDGSDGDEGKRSPHANLDRIDGIMEEKYESWTEPRDDGQQFTDTVTNPYTFDRHEETEEESESEEFTDSGVRDSHRSKKADLSTIGGRKKPFDW